MYFYIFYISSGNLKTKRDCEGGCAHDPPWQQFGSSYYEVFSVCQCLHSLHRILKQIEPSIPAQSEYKNTEVNFLTKLCPFHPASYDCILPDMLLTWGKLIHKLANVGDSKGPSTWHLSFKLRKQYKYRHNSLTEKELNLHLKESGICSILLVVCNLPIHFLQV